MRHVPIDDDDAGQRLDNFLVRLCREVPKSHLYRLIRSGQLRVNGKRQAADYRLQAGDSVRIPPIRLSPEAAAAAREPRATADDPVRRARAGLARRLPVLHEDEWLLAIDKPASVAVHGGSGVSSGVIEQLRAARPQARFLSSCTVSIGRRRGAAVALKRARWWPCMPSCASATPTSATSRSSPTLVAAHAHAGWPLHRHEAPEGDRRVSVKAGGGRRSRG